MNKNRIQAQFNKYAHSYNEEACVQQQAGKYLVDLCKKQYALFSSVLDIGTGTGVLLPHIYAEYPEAQVYCNDISKNMLASIDEKDYPLLGKICGDAEYIELPVASLYISNFAFQWFSNLYSTIQKMLNRCDVLAFTMLTHNTFSEWRLLCDEYGIQPSSYQYPTHEDLKEYLSTLYDFSYTIEECIYPMIFEHPKAFLHYLQRLGASTPAIARHQSMRSVLSIKEEFATQYSVSFILLWRNK